MSAAKAYGILFTIIAMLLALVVIWIIPGWTITGRVGCTSGWFVGAAGLCGFASIG